jgi:hypothetical protein
VRASEVAVSDRIESVILARDLEREDAVWSLEERVEFVELWRSVPEERRKVILARLRHLGAQGLGSGQDSSLTIGGAV